MVEEGPIALLGQAKGGLPTRDLVVRRALTRMSEEEAVQAILDAEKEPMLRGDLRTLLRKVK